MPFKWQVASGKWQVASGKWQVASGKWQVASGKWQVAKVMFWQVKTFYSYKQNKFCLFISKTFVYNKEVFFKEFRNSYFFELFIKNIPKPKQVHHIFL